ncbi:MAG: YggT family protein [Gemmatimonadaceae bacterium]|nr:YggT family protein [Gemmatimonadaceae bacterium]
MQDSKVGDDEARQVAQHNAVKSKVESRVNAEISSQAAATTPDDRSRVADVAGQMRDRAVDETARGERTLGHARTTARGSQFLDYAFFLVYSLLAIRFVLALIAARSTNGFVQLINTLSSPFYAPFKGIVPSQSAEGGYTLVVPILVALLAYAILHGVINAALRMVGQRKTEI